MIQELHESTSFSDNLENNVYNPKKQTLIKQNLNAQNDLQNKNYHEISERELLKSQKHELEGLYLINFLIDFIFGEKCS